MPRLTFHCTKWSITVPRKLPNFHTYMYKICKQHTVVALFVPLILVNVLQIFGTVSQLIPILHRSLDLSIV